MANKNLSQLPTNATPQETDWLLGASGMSPAVFQKIPVGAIQPTGGSGGSIKFSLPINENTALTSSGYYFTDNIAGNIGIDCSQLGIGDHISWVNLSTKAIVFYGLATVNGTTIPANKGVRIEANTFIEFFLKDANFNARVLAGSYSLGWIPGGAITVYDTSYVATPVYYSGTQNIPRTTNDYDIFYKLGTLSIDGSSPSSWINPVTRGNITVSASHFSSDSQKCFSNNVYYNGWNSGNNSPNWIQIGFSDSAKVELKRYALNARYWNNSLPSWILQGSNNGIDWVNIHSGTGLGTLIDQAQWYTSPAISSSEPYGYFRLYKSTPNTSIEEILFWGDYILGL